MTEHLEGDHRRLDAILPEVERLAGAGSLLEASSRFAEFTCGLSRHINVEERVLFPTFEQTTGTTMGPTTVMRGEHVEIRRLIDDVAAALKAGDAATTGFAIHGLTEILAAHNMKEERMLYPMADQAAGNERERDDLVKRLQAF